MTSSKRQKRSVLIAGIIAITLFMGYAIFQNISFETEWIYEKYNDGYKILSYTQAFDDNTTEIVVPDKYEGKDVVAIDDKVFYKNNKIKKVIIPDTVTELGASVFKKCKNLETVELSKNLTVIGGECFKECKSLTSIILPDSITEIRGETFVGCSSLKEVILPENITEIKGNTFENCSALESIYIPEGVTRIAAHAFYGCTSLSDVFVPDTVNEIGSSAFRKCDSLESIELPEGVSINERAFKESPTRLLKKPIPDDLWDDIVKEIQSKESYESLYVIYEKATGPDEIMILDDVVCIVDSIKYEEIIKEEYALREFKEPEELVGYLEEAKNKGAKYVHYKFYTEIGSKKAGTTYFVSANGEIDDAIADFQDSGYSSEFDKIEDELSTVDPQEKIDTLYVVCKEVDGEKVPDISSIDNSVWVGDVPHSDSWEMINTQKEILSFLKKAKILGASKVMFILDNKKIGESSGTAGWSYEIDEVIEGYLNDTWTFDGAYEHYLEAEKESNKE